jgi:hypothetical protein
MILQLQHTVVKLPLVSPRNFGYQDFAVVVTGLFGDTANNSKAITKKASECGSTITKNANLRKALVIFASG